MNTPTVKEIKLNTKSDVSAFISTYHENNMFIYKCIGFKGVLSIKDSKLHSFRKEFETKIGYPNARPHVNSKRIGLNKYSIEVDCSLCPNVLAAKLLDGLAEQGSLNARKFWDMCCNANHAKLLAFDHVYEIDSIINNAQVQRGKAYVAMTDAWRQAIGDAHRGMKYKTKALEGITWKWGQVGKRKVKLLIEQF